MFERFQAKRKHHGLVPRTCCKAKCLSNCSCTAYTNTDIRGGDSSYAMSFGNLIDIRKLQDDANREHKVNIAMAIMFAVCMMLLLANYILKVREGKA
ncbi:hypothetical protein FEM48_Zijuj01G0215400 [Ziziphus jujuba var. spinosa]|uniref:Apple domain-containing protein n=1 Tax=Ziziphus jujuba var. spinosa TaxID=714518 RepID=A0A978W3P1_ZIZJJ|nr:hypothetical protein FEM48_Zijuj01G0215400 [Ziziphus jujuba var. spinosa]